MTGNLKMFQVNQDLDDLAKILSTESLHEELADVIGEKIVKGLDIDQQWTQCRIFQALTSFSVSSITSGCWKSSFEKK